MNLVSFRIFALTLVCLPATASLMAPRAYLGAQSTRRGQDPSALACVWSAPKVLASAPHEATIRWPALSGFRDTLWVAGTAFPIEESAPIHRRGLILVRTPGEQVPIPPGDFLFAYPRVGHDGHGTLHLVWLESDDEDVLANSWMQLKFTSIWYSSFDGTRWSTPERILSAPRVAWGVEDGTLAVDAGGRIHVAAVVTNRAGTTSLFYLRRDNGSWSRRQFQRPVAYATAARWGGGNAVAIAYTSPVGGEAFDASSVFLITSDDAGEHWSEPALVSHSGNRLATVLTLKPDDYGGLHLVWGQNLVGGFEPQVLRHRVTRDGKSFQTYPDAPLSPGFLRYHLVADGPNDVRAVLERFDSGRLALNEIRWFEREVSSQQLFPQLSAAANAGLFEKNGSAWLVWSGIAGSGNNVLPFVSARHTCTVRPALATANP